ncbi:STAS domain-containing protein [Nonomuraea sp. NPDC050547]|uniref:STAS domain-containing protein n=1 Tax=Nonomuraea sp. NPDC050547 TaxID=3364368 RepID=UPI003787C9E4
MTPLHLTSRALIGGTLIEVAGELDIVTAAQLTAFIEREHPRPELPLVLELSALTFMDSSGLHLAAPHERVTRALEITGVCRLLRTHATLGQAITAADLIDPHAVLHNGA